MSEASKPIDDLFNPGPIHAGQFMNAMAILVANSLNLYLKPEDTDEQKTAASYVMISIFMHQFCMAAKHKDKMIKVLEIIIDELKEASNAEGNDQSSASAD